MKSPVSAPAATRLASHEATEPWHVALDDGATRAVRGAAPDPDVTLRILYGVSNYRTVLVHVVVPSATTPPPVLTPPPVCKVDTVTIRLPAPPPQRRSGPAHGGRPTRSGLP